MLVNNAGVLAFGGALDGDLESFDRHAGTLEHDFPACTQWAETRGGIRVPLPVTTARAEMSYADMNGGFVRCPKCKMP